MFQMINDPTIYWVFKVRSTQVDGEPTEERIIENYLFDSGAVAEISFKGLNLKIPELMFDQGREKNTWESKYLYKFGLGEDAKKLIAQNPKYDAERLAWDLKLDPRTGELLDQEPRRTPRAT